MAGKHTGTAKAVATWYRQQRWGESSSIELHALALEGAQLVTSWPFSEARANPEEWSSIVDELATSDAIARDQTTRYELRHVVEERVRGTMHLRRVVDPAPGPEETKPTGDTVSLIIQLQRGMERANAQVIEMAKVTTMTASAAIAAQEAALRMLGQAYHLIGGMQATQVEMHADKLDAAPAREKSVGDVAFEELVKNVTPLAVAHFAKQMQPGGDS